MRWQRRSVVSQGATTSRLGKALEAHRRDRTGRDAPPQRAKKWLLDGKRDTRPEHVEWSFAAVSNVHASGAQPPFGPMSIPNPDEQPAPKPHQQTHCAVPETTPSAPAMVLLHRVH